jgi:Omp85 superfamily domain
MTPRFLPFVLTLLFLVPATFAQDRSDAIGRSLDRVEELADRARGMADDLRGDNRDDARRAARLLDDAAESLEDGDIDDAEGKMDDAADLIESVIDDLRDDGYDGRADRLARIFGSLESETERVGDLSRSNRSRDRRDGRRSDDSFEDRMERLSERTGAWGERIGERVEEWADGFEESIEDEFDDYSRSRDRRRREDWRERRSRFRSYAPTFVGDFGDRWPYTETSTYRPISSIRYNRVDGLTLGVRRQPMDWDSYDRTRVFGQVSRSFGLDEWRYEAGGEARLGQSYSENDFDIKIGGAYRLETGTDDLWKASWAENTSAAFLFRTDLFDYYQTEGYTLYTIARLTPVVQASVAYRSDDYNSLARNATWSLFGGDSFRPNPAIDSGRMQSVITTLDGGRIRGLRWIPSGYAFRAQAEIGQGLGGDFNFNRYIGDVRAYLRPANDVGLSLRFRGGFSEGDLPLQKTFSLGGAGSVRAYPQNVFRGSEMLLANAELTFYDVDPLDGILDGVALFGLMDAGWVNGPGQNSFDMNDVIPAAGFGVALSDRQIRLELAWPLRDMGTGMEPTLWLRLNPTF